MGPAEGVHVRMAGHLGGYEDGEEKRRSKRGMRDEVEMSQEGQGCDVE